MSLRTFPILLLVLGCLAVASAPAAADGETEATAADQLFAPPPELPKEAGIVHWRRDWNAAVEESRQTGRPLFVQFQEVPG